jgi:hypothetical protein
LACEDVEGGHSWFVKMMMTPIMADKENRALSYRATGLLLRTEALGGLGFKGLSPWSRKVFERARSEFGCPACFLEQELWGEAAKKMAELVNDDGFRSLEGKSKHQLWLELCDLITKHPKEVEGLKVDAILRSGIRKFTDEVGCVYLLVF